MPKRKVQGAGGGGMGRNDEARRATRNMVRVQGNYHLGKLGNHNRIVFWLAANLMESSIPRATPPGPLFTFTPSLNP